MKGSIFDAAILGMVLVVAVMIMLLLTALWIPFKADIDQMNTNAAFPVSAANQTIIDNLGNAYFLQNGPIFLIFLFGAMVIVMLVSAWGENAGTWVLIPGIFAMICTIFISFLLSDWAHNFAYSASLSAITATYYAAPLYILDNLPIITGILSIAYLVIVSLKRRQPGSGALAGRIISD
jgi:hypothetical protein